MAYFDTVVQVYVDKFNFPNIVNVEAFCAIYISIKY